MQTAYEGSCETKARSVAQATHLERMRTDEPGYEGPLQVRPEDLRAEVVGSAAAASPGARPEVREDGVVVVRRGCHHRWAVRGHP